MVERVDEDTPSSPPGPRCRRSPRRRRRGWTPPEDEQWLVGVVDLTHGVDELVGGLDDTIRAAGPPTRIVVCAAIGSSCTAIRSVEPDDRDAAAEHLRPLARGGELDGDPACLGVDSLDDALTTISLPRPGTTTGV